jgi:multiple antibiotic resistance protein
VSFRVAAVPFGHDRRVDPLNLADAFVTFFAVLGPQKVLLSVAQMARTRDLRAMRLVQAYASIVAACVGVTCTLAAPGIASFFHITTASVALASGVVFFVYAIGMVFGVHFGEGAAQDEDTADARHPVASGFRELLLPFIVSPLGVAAALEASLTVSTWGARVTVAAAYTAVVAVNLVAALIFGPLIRRAHPTSLEVLSRLLGILLTAVGVDLFLQGLSALGVHIGGGH